MLAASFYLIQQRQFQAKMLPYAIQQMEEKFGTQIHIDSVEAKFFKRLALYNVYIEDCWGDTLFVSETVNIKVNKINLDKRNLSLKQVTFDKLHINFHDNGDTLNFNVFLGNILKNKGEGKEAWSIVSDYFEFNNATFSYYIGNDRVVTPGKFNFRDFQLNKLELITENFEIADKAVSFDINNISFMDKSGFEVKNFIARAHISGNGMVFESPFIETGHSILLGEKLAFLHDDFQDYKKGGIIDKVPLYINLDASSFNFQDLSFFSENLKPVNQSFIFSGSLSGTVDALKGDDVTVRVGNSSYAKGDVYFNGLPITENTYVHAQIQQMLVNTGDIESIAISGGTKSIQIPALLKKMGDFRYKGNFTGFFNDFFTYGTISTSIGQINTDMSLKPDSLNVTTLRGKAQVVNYDIGKLLSIPKMGLTNFSVDIQGKIVPDSGFVSTLNGTVQSLVYNDYTYKQIDLETKINGPNINAGLKIDDENIKASLSGNFNHLNQVPFVRTNIDISEANLQSLNFSDSLLMIGFQLYTKFEGERLDDFNGYCNVKDLLIFKGEDSLDIGEVYLDMLHDKVKGKSSLTLISTIIDAEIEGNFKYSTLAPSYHNIAYTYLNNIYAKDSIVPCVDTNNFTFWADIKDAHTALSFLIPGVSVSGNTYIKGKYNAFQNIYDLNLLSPYLVVDDLILKGIQFNSWTSDSSLTVETGCEYLLHNQLRFDNLTFNTDFKDNKADINLRWNNWDSSLYKGDISALAEFYEHDSSMQRMFDLKFSPSTFIVNDSIWHINKGKLAVVGDKFGLDDFMIYNDRQNLNVSGVISRNPNDSLKIDFDNFKLGSLNLLLSAFGTQMNGVLNGGISVSDFYNDRFVIASFEATGFKVNQVGLGNLKAVSEWDNRQKRLNLSLETDKDGVSPLVFNGYVVPETKEVFGNGELEQFKLSLIQPYLSDITSEINGVGNGKFTVTEKWDKPVFNGEVDIIDAQFNLDYLGTSYSFSDKIEVKDNVFVFDKIKLKDRYSNLATLDGTISAESIKLFELDLHINTAKFLFLETTIYDNEDFYGTAFAGGNINIKGPTSMLRFDVLAKTLDGTVFNVPLESSSEAYNEFAFIDFYPKVQLDEDEMYLVKQREKVKTNNNVILNFDLEVTPEAEVQLIFDSKVGDIIRGRGQGNLKMEVNSSGTFKMYGNLEVVEGDYLFTLNVFNRKFKIVEGGVIQWNGSPTEAYINIQANYNLRANINYLLPTESIASTSEISQVEAVDGGQSTSGNQAQRNVLPVECQLFLMDNLMKPTTKFGINLPTADEKLKNTVNSILSSDEELSRQFISLLIINSFVPLSSGGFNLGDSEEAINVAAIELVSNQLSHLLSQFDENLNINLDYYNDPDISRQELELVLQYQMFKNKVTINGEFDVPTQNDGPYQDNTLIGDFDIDVKLTDNGKLRLKAFNREHNSISDIDLYYTQGVGFLFREEFNTFGELMQKYFNKLFNRPKDIQVEEDLLLN